MQIDVTLGGVRPGINPLVQLWRQPWIGPEIPVCMRLLWARGIHAAGSLCPLLWCSQDQGWLQEKLSEKRSASFQSGSGILCMSPITRVLELVCYSAARGSLALEPELKTTICNILIKHSLKGGRLGPVICSAESNRARVCKWHFTNDQRNAVLIASRQNNSLEDKKWVSVLRAVLGLQQKDFVFLKAFLPSIHLPPYQEFRLSTSRVLSF